MASSKKEAVYAAVETDHPADDIPVAEAIGIQSVEVEAPCDLPEGYQLSVETKRGKKTVVVAVCIINVAFVAFDSCIFGLTVYMRGQGYHAMPRAMWPDLWIKRL
jgi:hypothetical protein